MLVSRTVNTNSFTLSSNNLSLVSDNDEYTWTVEANATINKNQVTSLAAESTFKVQMEDADSTELNLDNLVLD